MTIGDRIQTLMKSMQLKQWEFAEKFGVSKNSIIRYKTNDRFPDTEFLLKLADEKVNINWVLKGEGPMMIPGPWEQDNTIKRNQRYQIIGGRQLLIDEFGDTYIRSAVFPILAEISAGPPTEAVEDKESRKQIEIPDSYIPRGASQYLAFMVSGNSMAPKIRNEDIVLIYKTIDWESADGQICAVRVDGGITLKRVKLDHKRLALVLEPLNLDFKTLILDEDQTRDVFLIGTLAVQLRLCGTDLIY
ncbi:MAG: XRE family transcriptional regulator [Candidatus Cloacimonas sp.]|nr:XRE family transcriptional regulator [Candidatus Cloacimonas sp.]